MKQERENGTFDDIILSLRYGIKSKEIATAIEKILEKNNIKYNIYEPNKRNREKYIIVIDDLDINPIDPLLIKKMNEDFLIENDFDFFLGITSSYEMGGFTVPSYIVEYIRILGGKIEFSYIC